MLTRRRRVNPEIRDDGHIQAAGLGLGILTVGLSLGEIYRRPEFLYAGAGLGALMMALHWRGRK